MPVVRLTVKGLDLPAPLVGPRHCKRQPQGAPPGHVLGHIWVVAGGCWRVRAGPKWLIPQHGGCGRVPSWRLQSRCSPR
jgi:hypothetical protein